ncbi:MAG TPA: hydrogenase iron-sulfur subunit [Planctomycetota bacterium]|nr:hydrogenase iron-sulfur subunit [Planctomycetota bacterium]HRR82170.1 hydrogenase iron-sulfur subunit [Planctomycetota bacterium]HRT96877.1 hydrogenase iron-sulfur subunit [Planctomycetota bacterium]
MSHTATEHDATPAAATAEWKPNIVAFLCNWCSYAGADLAGMSRFGYPAAIRIIRVPCSGRVDPMFILKSFERGADMVLVSGCHPGDCHYTSGNFHARRKLQAFRELMSFLGIDPRRFKMSWVSAAEGGKWSALVNEITEEARRLGPFTGYPSCENGNGRTTREQGD